MVVAVARNYYVLARHCRRFLGIARQLLCVAMQLLDIAWQLLGIARTLTRLLLRVSVQC